MKKYFILALIFVFCMASIAEARRTSSSRKYAQEEDRERATDFFGNTLFASAFIEIEAGYFFRELTDGRNLQHIGGHLGIDVYPGDLETYGYDQVHYGHFHFFMDFTVEPSDHQKKGNVFFFQSFLELGAAMYLVNDKERGFIDIGLSIDLLRQDPHDAYFGILAAKLNGSFRAGVKFDETSLMGFASYCLGIGPDNQRIEGYKLGAVLGFHPETNVDISFGYIREKLVAKGFTTNVHSFILTTHAVTAEITWHISGNVAWHIVSGKLYLDSREKISSYRFDKFQITTGLTFTFS